jgi:hypothetical protein
MRRITIVNLRRSIALAIYVIALLLIVVTLLTIAAMDQKAPLVWRVDGRISC